LLVEDGRAPTAREVAWAQDVLLRFDERYVPELYRDVLRPLSLRMVAQSALGGVRLPGPPEGGHDPARADAAVLREALNDIDSWLTRSLELLRRGLCLLEHRSGRELRRRAEGRGPAVA